MKEVISAGIKAIPIDKNIPRVEPLKLFV